MEILNSNIHPLIVHFPIALLSVYAIMELISWGRLRQSLEWMYVKFAFVGIGAIAAVVARHFGEVARSLISGGDSFPLIDKHEFFATTTVIIFGFLAAGYIGKLIRPYVVTYSIYNIAQPVWKFLFALQALATETILAKILALAGLITLTITGALGGSIVYGPTNDPFTEFIYKLFF